MVGWCWWCWWLVLVVLVFWLVLVRKLTAGWCRLNWYVAGWNG